MDYRELGKRVRNMLIFGAAYLGTFFFIESRNVPINIIHTPLDDKIPFCEYFIVPYVIWYLYVAGTLMYFGFQTKKTREYNCFVTNMALGMIVFVAVSFIYPNGQNLRPELTVDNPFKWAVNFLYTIDTSTNILPSLHVFASVACDMALCMDSNFKKHSSWKLASHTISLLIILSTMFLKQHSVIDVVAALICNLLFFPVIYHKELAWVSARKLRKPVHLS